MIRVYHVTSGEVRDVDAPDARELVETGRWTRQNPSSAVPFLPADTNGGVQDGSDSAPCSDSGASGVTGGPPDASATGATGGAALTIIELRERLKVAGVAFPSNAPKADLVKLFDACRA